MSRHVRYEENRWVGDKRTQVVHDQDHLCEDGLIGAIHDAGAALVFGPDTDVEARNRGYRVCRACASASTDAA